MPFSKQHAVTVDEAARKLAPNPVFVARTFAKPRPGIAELIAMCSSCRGPNGSMHKTQHEIRLAQREPETMLLTWR